MRIWNSFQIAPPQYTPPLASAHPVFVEQVCDIAGIYLERFSNQAEALKANEQMLEIAAGMKPAVQRAAGGHLSNTLVEAVREAYARVAILDMAGKQLKGHFDSSQMERVLAVGRLCVDLERQHRPNIKKAVNLLSDLNLPIVNLEIITG